MNWVVLPTVRNCCRCRALAIKPSSNVPVFLRINGSENPLDASAVHPEAYGVVQQMAADLSTEVKHLAGNEALIKNIQPKKYVTEQIGELTIRDICNELKKPGLDPRSEIQSFEFANIFKIEEVGVGMFVPGHCYQPHTLWRLYRYWGKTRCTRSHQRDSAPVSFRPKRSFKTGR